MVRAGLCIVCGLAPVEPSTTTTVLCTETCVREAGAELPRLVGRLHQLEQLQARVQTRPWPTVLHPANRRNVAGAELETAQLIARISLLERSIDAWHTAQPAAVDATLGPLPAPSTTGTPVVAQHLALG